MARDVKVHVRRCLDCRRRKTLGGTPGEEQLRVYQRPGEDVGIDLIGPFPETSLFGYRHVLTVYDFFNHYLVGIPLRDKRPETVARGLLTQYLAVRSCPRRFHSDGGREFTDAVLAELNRLLAVGHRYSSAYRPQSGGQTERSHRFLNDAVSTYVNKLTHRDWDLWIYGAVFAHNVSPLAGTDGLTPFFLEFGREPVFPEAAGVQAHPLLPLTKEHYAEAMLQRLEEGRSAWADINKEQREKQKQVHDEGVCPRDYTVGDHVLVTRHPRKEPKLVTKWLSRVLGPYKVVERARRTDNRNLYILEDVHSGARTAPTNADRMVPMDWYADVLRQQRAEIEEAPATAEGKRFRRKRLEAGGVLPAAAFRARVGQYLVYRCPGEVRSLGADTRAVLDLLWGTVSAAPEKKVRTGQAAAAVYSANPALKAVVRSCGGLRGVLRRTPSLELDSPLQGGDNFVQVVQGEGTLRLYDSVLGEQLRLGQLLDAREELGVSRLVIHEHDRINPRGNWGGGLCPLYLSQVTGEVLRGETQGSEVEPVVREVPAGHLQFFVDVDAGPPPHLKPSALARLQDIHAVVHVVRGLGASGCSQRVFGLVVNCLLAGAAGAGGGLRGSLTCGFSSWLMLGALVLGVIGVCASAVRRSPRRRGPLNFGANSGPVHLAPKRLGGPCLRGPKSDPPTRENDPPCLMSDPPLPSFGVWASGLCGLGVFAAFVWSLGIGGLLVGGAFLIVGMSAMRPFGRGFAQAHAQRRPPEQTGEVTVAEAIKGLAETPASDNECASVALFMLICAEFLWPLGWSTGGGVWLAILTCYALGRAKGAGGGVAQKRVGLVVLILFVCVIAGSGMRLTGGGRGPVGGGGSAGRGSKGDDRGPSAAGSGGGRPGGKASGSSCTGSRLLTVRRARGAGCRRVWHSARCPRMPGATTPTGTALASGRPGTTAPSIPT